MSLSCAELMQEAKTEYVSVPLDTRSGKTVDLRNLLMLSPDGMSAARVLLASMEKVNDDDAELLVSRFRDLLLLLADEPRVLADEMDDWPMAMYMRVINAWQEATQMGEAFGSDS